MRLMRDTVKMKMRMTGRSRQNLGCDRCTARTVGGLWLGQECQLTHCCSLDWSSCEARLLLLVPDRKGIHTAHLSAVGARTELQEVVQEIASFFDMKSMPSSELVINPFSKSATRLPEKAPPRHTGGAGPVQKLTGENFAARKSAHYLASQSLLVRKRCLPGARAWL